VRVPTDVSADVRTPALTSVGTLTSLTVSGNVNITGTGYLQLPAGTTQEQPGQTGNPSASAGMLRYNTSTSVFEGYDGNVWGKIGGGAAVQAAAPTNANEGDLWYDEDDGRLFVYYNDGTSSQWVDASPNGVPTDLTVEGTLSVSGTTTLSGNTQIGGLADSGANAGIYLATSGLVQAARTSGTTAVFAGYTAGNSSETSRINADGSAEFNNIQPNADAVSDLGSPSRRWANIYSADLQLSNEGGANDVDGTWGQYTIQEGEEDLFLINRRNGKKYKFMLQEVN